MKLYSFEGIEQIPGPCGIRLVSCQGYTLPDILAVYRQHGERYTITPT